LLQRPDVKPVNADLNRQLYQLLLLLLLLLHCWFMFGKALLLVYTAPFG
jgi:hypothetical protein